MTSRESLAEHIDGDRLSALRAAMSPSLRGRLAELASLKITPSLIASLRLQIDAPVLSWLLEIASVQPRAVKKFGEGIWFATPRAIEQSSDLVVAHYKASLFSAPIIIDLCGGIGGDAIAFARSHRLITVDRDPIMTLMAASNLHASSARSAAAVCDDVMSYASRLDLRKRNVALHIDPDRRAMGTRTIDPREYSPPLTWVLETMSVAKQGMVKLAPAAQTPPEVADRFHRQWISYQNSVREQTWMFGETCGASRLAAGGRSAVRLTRHGEAHVFAPSDLCKDDDGQKPSAAPEPLAYIYDLDPAVRAAGLSTTFARQHSLAALGEPSGFFTGDHGHRWPLAQAFQVVWSGPADIKQIKKEVRRLGLAIETVKVRGTDHQPERLQKQLAVESASPREGITLLLGRSTCGIYACLAKPLF